jgi:hypothetical protein
VGPAIPGSPDVFVNNRPALRVGIRASNAAYDALTHVEPDEDEEEAEAEEKSWIGIELVDEDDNPIASERNRIALPDGETIDGGTTDSNGVARGRGIDPGTCQITFPNLNKDAGEKD